MMAAGGANESTRSRSSRAAVTPAAATTPWIGEIDGVQHYSLNGTPSPAVYASTMRGDRELRLAGYEIYRFAGQQMQPDNAAAAVSDSFTGLLHR